MLTDKQLGAAFAVLDIGGTGQLTVETFLTLLGVNVSFVTPEKLVGSVVQMMFDVVY